VLGGVTVVGDALSRRLADGLAHPGVALLARIALVSPFAVSGILKALDFPGAVAEVHALTGLDSTAGLAALVIITQLLGSATVIAGGRAVWLGAALLAGFTVVATLLAHAFWTKAGVDRMRDLSTFFEHVGLVSGFVLAAILVARSERAR
jgi:uncharacterized membrane protein YphA (DoxX/SURF4 family)